MKSTTLFKSNKLLSLLVMFLVPVAFVFAGFNETMDQVLDEKELTCGSAAWLVATGSGQIPQDSTIEEALKFMTDKVPRLPAEKDRAVTLGEFALLIMKAWDIKGGLFYTLIPSPRYALRELRFLNIVQGRAFSRMKISGERGVRILGRVLSWKEAR